MKTRDGFEPPMSGLQPDALPLGYRVRRAVTGFEPVWRRRNATSAMPAQPQLLCTVYASQTITYASLLYGRHRHRLVCRFASARYFPLTQQSRFMCSLVILSYPTPTKWSGLHITICSVFVPAQSCVYPFPGCFLINAQARVRSASPCSIVDPFRSPLLRRWSYHPFRCTVISSSP